MTKSGEKKETFYVVGMSCAGCATNVEMTLSKQKGVKEAKVNFASSTVWVVYQEEETNPLE